MGNCMSNTGSFEPPGSQAVRAFTAARDLAADPVRQQLEAAYKAELKRQSTAAGAGATKPKGPKCCVCFRYCAPTANPWQMAQLARRAAEMSESDDDEVQEVADGPKRRPGIQIASCKHKFCGACLAQAIYLDLNLTFDEDLYGTVLKDQQPVAVGRRPEFPIRCPECRGKPGEQPLEISDQTAQLVLGPRNMDAWNHQRFLSGLNLIYCPHKGCEEQFDADDVAPAPSGVKHASNLVQCPRCRNSLCKECKCVWHDKLTCEQYRALPINERAPEDVAFANLAQQEKWRRCPNCSSMVELKFGCNHITCVCKHHFCYQCGSPFQHTGGKYRCTGGRGCKIWEEQNLLARGT